jgi:hypothetical protein
MTPKQAMIARCLDCCTVSKCNLDCPLFDLVNLNISVNWIGVILQYCQWCKNRNPGNQCANPECSINQYRTTAKGNVHADFLPFIHGIDNKSGVSQSKNTSGGDIENEDCKNVNSDGRIV